MNNRLGKLIVSLIAIAGGILFIVLGVADFSHVKNYPEIEVTVTQIERDETVDTDGTTTEETTVHVSYTVDGKEYNEILDDAPDNLKEGDKLTVRYNPEKPEKVTAASKKSGIMRIALGALFAIVGLGMIVKSVIRGK